MLPNYYYLPNPTYTVVYQDSRKAARDAQRVLEAVRAVEVAVASQKAAESTVAKTFQAVQVVQAYDAARAQTYYVTFG